MRALIQSFTVYGMSSTSSGVGILEAPDTIEQLDWSPMCDWGGLRSDGEWVSEPGCEREAEWIGTALCCGLVRFYCEEHRIARLAFIASRPAVTHRICGAKGAPMRYEPLRGGAS